MVRFQTEFSLNMFARLLAIAVLGLIIAGCAPRPASMRDQPRYEPLEASTFFENGTSARHPPEDTVARSQLRTDTHFYTGMVDGEPAATFPFEITHDVLERGQERYNIYCAPCHSELGDGQGIIVQRGFPAPPSFHSERLRTAPPGHFYDVITNGFGRMYDYSDKIHPEDRWAIVAYVQALQLSQHATIEEVPADQQQQLESGD